MTEQRVQFGDLIVSAGLGALGSMLPDMLEPATNPSHRQFFHSWVTAALLARANLWISQDQSIPAETKDIFTFISAGYLSHLLADGQSPKGLPII
jgi:inner membrane protein